MSVVTVVVGGGILGLAVARQLLVDRPDAPVVVLEKEGRVAAHQTGHNSGVVHAGLYYKPGSLKARLCRQGVGLLKQFCDEHSIPYDECGKLVVARDEDELVGLRTMHERASALGVPGLRLITRFELREREPHVEGIAALHSPSTAVVDFSAVAQALAAEVAARGGEVVVGASVTAIDESPRGATVRAGATRIEADAVVLCTGLHADRVARLAGGSREPAILPFRGEYFRIARNRAHLVRSLVYPVPDPRYPFLGVHFTRRVDGTVDVGPNAVLALAREGYRWRDVAWRDMREMAAFPGTWRLARRHWRTGVHEVVGSVSKRAFLRRARSYVPDLRSADLEAAPAGVRAQAVGAGGELVDDFVVEARGRVVALRNAPSPAATASLAIAAEVVAAVRRVAP